MRASYCAFWAMAFEQHLRCAFRPSYYLVVHRSTTFKFWLNDKWGLLKCFRLIVKWSCTPFTLQHNMNVCIRQHNLLCSIRYMNHRNVVDTIQVDYSSYVGSLLHNWLRKSGIQQFLNGYISQRFWHANSVRRGYGARRVCVDLIFVLWWQAIFQQIAVNTSRPFGLV